MRDAHQGTPRTAFILPPSNTPETPKNTTENTTFYQYGSDTPPHRVWRKNEGKIRRIFDNLQMLNGA